MPSDVARPELIVLTCFTSCDPSKLRNLNSILSMIIQLVMKTLVSLPPKFRTFIVMFCLPVYGRKTYQIISLVLFVTPVVLLFTLFALFAEPSVGKVPTKRLGEDLRGPRNCRHVYSLLAMQQPYQQTHYIVSFHGWLNRQSHEAALICCHFFWVELINRCTKHNPWSASTSWHACSGL